MTSTAVTVKVPGLPAVAGEGKPVTTNPAGTTTIPDCVPVMLASAVSVAVRDCVPTVSRAASKLPVPLVRVTSAGRVALESLLLKCTVPA